MPESFLGPFIGDLRFNHPFAIVVSGTTGAGKSTFLKNMIEKDGIKGTINEIYYFMPQIEKLNIKTKSNQIIQPLQGLPDRKWMDDQGWTTENSKRDALFIFDDLWTECINNDTTRQAVTWARNHLGISVAFVTQYFFEQSKTARLMKYDTKFKT